MIYNQGSITTELQSKPGPGKFTIGTIWIKAGREKLFSVVIEELPGREIFGEIAIIKAKTLPGFRLVLFPGKAGKGLSPLKTKDARKVPICKELYELLDEQTGNRFFTFDAGEGVPLGVKFAITRFDKIVSSEFPEEKEEKKLVFHSLRHFFNTYLQAENVPINKVDAVIGHSG